MKKLNDLKVGTRLGGAFFVLTIMLLATSGIAYWGMSSMASSEKMVEQRSNDINVIHRMEFYAVKQYQNQADYIINGDKVSIDDFEESASNFEKNLLQR